MSDTLIYILCVIVSYLIGSLSPAIMLSKFYGKNIMKEGSGNAGATNVVRIFGWKIGLIVFVADVLKGFIFTFLILVLIGNFAAYVSAIAVVVGHIFSVFHKFKAGKGVATSIGVMLAIDWKIAIICCVIGIILVLITRRVSVGSIVSSIALPFLSWFMLTDFFVFSIFIAALIIYSHRKNIIRIFKGLEKPLF